MYKFTVECNNESLYSEILKKISEYDAYLLGGGISNNKFISYFKATNDSIEKIMRNEEINKYVFLQGIY